MTLYLIKVIDTFLVCGCKDTVWADHGVLPDVDMGIIHVGQPEVGIDIWYATARKCCGAGTFRFSGDSTNDGTIDGSVLILQKRK